MGERDKRKIKMREMEVVDGRRGRTRSGRRNASSSHTAGILSSSYCRETRVGEEIRMAQGKKTVCILLLLSLLKIGGEILKFT